MKCLILAAGYATRLYPLTENFPKPLLKVGDKTIIDWLLDDMESSGVVDGFSLVTNHRFSEIFKNNVREGVSVVDDGTSTNETRLGAVRDIECAVESLKIDDDLLVVAGDNLLDFSLCKFISYAAEKSVSCIMRYFESDPKRLSKSAVVEVDEEDKVLSMQEKPLSPKSNWCCPPFYFYTREDVKLIKRAIEEGCGVDAPGSLMAWISERRPVYAMQMPGNRYDIGNLESYNRVCATYKGIGGI